MESLEPLSAHTKDGWHLRGEVLSAGSGKSPVAVLLHAMMASRKTMDRPRGAGLGSVLAARGLGVVAFDLRGHGESGPSAREGARYTYDDYVLHDVPAVVSAAREVFPERPVVVVGHSLGGHAALASAGVFPEKAPDAIVSMAGNIWAPSCEPDLLRRIKKTAQLRVFLAIAETVGYVDPRPLRMGTDAVALPYVQQFWTMWSQDRYGNMEGTIDYREALGRVAIPVFSVTSEGDGLLAHPVAVERFFAPVRHKTLRVFRHEEFGGVAPDHMGIVTNAKSRRVWEQVGDWIHSICK